MGKLVDKAKAIRDGKAAVLRRLNAAARLSDRDREIVSQGFGAYTEHKSGQELPATGSGTGRAFFVLSGWICRAVPLPDGRRQIVDFHIPGDLAGHASRPTAGLGIYMCLTGAMIASAGEIIARTKDRPPAQGALGAVWPAIEEEVEQRLIDQIVRLASMSAQARTLHLIRDLHRRHRRAGICNKDGFVMPLTQQTIGNVLGLSTIHVNRILQQLRRDDAIKTSLGRIEILGNGLNRIGARAEQ